LSNEENMALPSPTHRRRGFHGSLSREVGLLFSRANMSHRKYYRGLWGARPMPSKIVVVKLSDSGWSDVDVLWEQRSPQSNSNAQVFPSPTHLSTLLQFSNHTCRGTRPRRWTLVPPFTSHIYQIHIWSAVFPQFFLRSFSSPFRVISRNTSLLYPLQDLTAHVGERPDFPLRRGYTTFGVRPLTATKVLGQLIHFSLAPISNNVDRGCTFGTSMH